MKRFILKVVLAMNERTAILVFVIAMIFIIALEQGRKLKDREEVIELLLEHRKLSNEYIDLLKQK